MIDTKTFSTAYAVIHKVTIPLILNHSMEDGSLVTPMTLADLQNSIRSKSRNKRRKLCIEPYVSPWLP